MTNIRAILLSTTVSSIGTFLVMFLMFGINRGNASSDSVKNELKSKASIEYVDREIESVQNYASDADTRIIEDIKGYKGEQSDRHKSEAQQVQEKLDLIIKLIEKR